MPQGRHTTLTVPLTPVESRTLAAWTRSQTLSVGQVRRARLILMVAEGMAISQVAQTVGVARRHVYKWVARFLAQGLAGLRDQRRQHSGRRRWLAQETPRRPSPVEKEEENADEPL